MRVGVRAVRVPDHMIETIAVDLSQVPTWVAKVRDPEWLPGWISLWHVLTGVGIRGQAGLPGVRVVLERWRTFWPVPPLARMACRERAFGPGG